MNVFKHLQSKKGSSSVLVILIVVVLLVFGTLALMSSYSDLKLTRKSGEWIKNYYSLEAEGDSLVQQIDSLLFKAAVEAGQYIDNRAFEGLTSDSIPDSLQAKIREGWLSRGYRSESEVEFLKNLYTKLYYSISAQSLIESNYDLDVDYSAEITTADSLFNNSYVADNKGVLRVSTTLTKGSEGSIQALHIVIDILCPDNSFNDIRELKEAARYNIISWKQLQNQFDYDNQPELWDGEVDSQ